VLGPTLAAEFALSAAQLGLLTGIFFFTVGLFMIPLGVLLDRFGPRRVSLALLVIAAVGAAFFATARSYEQLVVARALASLGLAAGLMAAMQAFILWFPPERTGTMIALAYSMGGLGALTVSVPLELALRVWPWRDIFAAFAAVTLAQAAVFAFAVPEHAASARRPAALRQQLDGLRRVLADPAFRRIAVALGSTQCAAISLFTLWMNAWLRDVGGFDRAAAAVALAWVSLALIAGYFFFGRLADRLARGRRSQLPLFLGGMAIGLAAFGPLVLGFTRSALALWCVFIFCSTGATLAHSIATRRYPREMAGRVNAALNTCTFVGIFFGQWAVGVVLSRWPASGEGYAPEAYGWAFGALWLVMASGLAWLWAGRALLAEKPRYP
jgi:predicted MFS family arabinose efflux permease